MKKIILLLIVATLSLSASAQQGNGGNRQGGKIDNKEQIEAFKIAYMTEKLALTTSQSQLFWPLYNEYDAAVRDVMKSRREVHRKINSSTATISDVNTWLDAEARIVEIRRSYISRFQDVISADQIAKLLAAEEDFKQELVRSIRRGGQLE